MRATIWNQIHVERSPEYVFCFVRGETWRVQQCTGEIQIPRTSLQDSIGRTWLVVTPLAQPGMVTCCHVHTTCVLENPLRCLVLLAATANRAGRAKKYIASVVRQPIFGSCQGFQLIWESGACRGEPLGL